ncbi:hypothetical protein CVIRNUC_002578 [Coccomyxa viridis]|uniref:Uncharacterized protein n=1 Tax=Coccomyxa viridis TaxID=1274662 RepID=A0AAV1HXN7_9CHLO|nr:hypothetical protein CVIRNUC_002578 [Coccomyxa viridis]
MSRKTFRALTCLTAILTAASSEARSFTGHGRHLMQMAAPPVTASAVRSTAAPYLIDPWTVGMTYPEVNITAGQSVDFKWPGRHGVYMLMDDTCPDHFDTNGPNILSPIKVNGDYTTPPLSKGTYTYACQVPGHCEDGQIVQVNVL